jgi:hypothetical protein
VDPLAIAYELGVKLAFERQGYQPQSHTAVPWDQQPSYFAFGNSPMGGQAKSAPMPEAPAPSSEIDLGNLHSSIALSDFADMPENYMIEAQDEADRLMSTGSQYVEQLSEMYKYLRQHGIPSEEAVPYAKKMLAQNFQRFATQAAPAQVPQ